MHEYDIPDIHGELTPILSENPQRTYWRHDLLRAIEARHIHPATCIPYYRAIYSLVATTERASDQTFLTQAEIYNAHRTYDTGRRAQDLHIPRVDFDRYLQDRWAHVMDLIPIPGGVNQTFGYRGITSRREPLTHTGVLQALNEMVEGLRS